MCVKEKVSERERERSPCTTILLRLGQAVVIATSYLASIAPKSPKRPYIPCTPLCVRVYVRVCVCVRERERGRVSKKEKERERETPRV